MYHYISNLVINGAMSCAHNLNHCFRVIFTKRLIIVYITITKFLQPETSITNKPAFYIALTSMIIGVQLFLAGFIAELVNRNAPERNTYLISDKLGW